MDWFESSRSQSWRGLNLNDLDVDEAYLNVTSAFYDKLAAYSLSTNCVKCPFQRATELRRSASSGIFRVSTKHNSLWRLYIGDDAKYKLNSDNVSLVCEIDGRFGEFGVYDLVVDEKKCNLTVSKEPVNIFTPILIIFLGLLLLYWLVRREWNRRRQRHTDEETETSRTNGKKSTRIRSIDTFRGFALTLMIFVNDGAGKYWFFDHCTWDGLYPADLLFPWFLWIMGVCITLSQKSRNTESVSTVLRNILQRASILFILGLSLNTLGVGPIDLGNLRIPGVLQRIAISYAVVSIVGTLTRKFDEGKCWSGFCYIPIPLSQWVIHVFLLGVHYCFTFYLSVPGCPRGYLGAGGMQDNFNYENCTGGATGYIDRLILGEKRLWQNAAVRRVYHTLPFDPENVLGCLPSIFQTFLGLQAGLILTCQPEPVRRIRCFLGWSFILLLLGLVLHHSGLIPLNKNLWSLSFVLATSGLAYIMFAVFYYVIDCAHLWNGSPFIYPGMNSVLVYVGHEVCFQLFPWHWKTAYMNTHWCNLIENVWGVTLWILITYALYTKGVFVSV